MTAPPERPFWRTKTLAQMSPEEWESLCDGCGKCCLHKVQIKGTKLKITNVACRLLDSQSCKCSNYARRKTLVPDCVVLTLESVGELGWLPTTCAYRLVHEGKDLFDWHPLKSGSDETVHEAKVSVRGRIVGERKAGSLVQHIVPWKDY